MRSYLRSFAGGIVSPELFGRGDTAKLQTGLALVQNFVTLPHGPARNRPGEIHAAKAKTIANGKMVMLPFKFSTSQAYVVEFAAGASVGTGVIRLHNADGTPVTYSAPAAYHASATCTFANGSATITRTSHGFSVGQKVGFTSGGLMPNITTLGRDMVSGDTFVVFSTPTADTFTVREVNGTTQLVFGFTSIGTITSHRAYQPGEIVSSGGVNYYAIPNATDSLGNAPPNPTWWYVLPQNPNILEVPHGYIGDNLQFVRYFQSNDVMTLLHEDHPPRELRRYSAERWAVEQIRFTSSLIPPASFSGTATQAGVRETLIERVASTTGAPRFKATSGVSLSRGQTVYGECSTTGGFPTTVFALGFYRIGDVQGQFFDLLNVDGSIPALGGGGPPVAVTGQIRVVPASSETSNTYIMTVTDRDGLESAAGGPITVTNNLFTDGAYNTLTWGAVLGAQRYNVYKLVDGLYGWIASTEPSVRTLRDDNLEAQMDRTLPFTDTVLGSSPYPEAGCYHEQRRAFARAQNIWMTRTGTESDMTYRLPVKPDDRVDLPLAATEFCRIQHLVSLGELVALSDSIEFSVRPVDSEVIAPGSAMARPLSFVGSSHIRPVVALDRIAYAAARGGHMRELRYADGGFANSDLSVFAPHLFDNKTLVQLALAKAPYQILWAVSSDGSLLGLTYLPEHEVAGWHRHTFSGTVKSIAVVPYGNEDRLFLAIERTINGVTETHIGYLAPWALGAVADSVYVDSAKQVTNVAAGVVSGFSHLAGKTVVLLADGIVLPQQVVSTSGQITLPSTKTTYAKVTVGYPIDAQLQTLPVFMQIEAMAQGRQKTTARMWVRTVDSGPFWQGPSASLLAPSDATAPAVRRQTIAQPVASGVVEMRSSGLWTQDAQLLITNPFPLPLTVATLTIEVGVGD
jgi:hypothetical protein